LRRRQAFANVRHVNVSPLVALAGLVTIGLLAMRLPRLPRRYLPSLDATLAGSGALVLAGLVLGPGIDVLDRPVLAALAPVTTLAVGWIGAALGARLERRSLRRVPRAAWLVAGISAGAAWLAVAVGAWLLTRVAPALAAAWSPRWPAILTLAAVAAVAGPAAVARIARTSGVVPRTARALSLAATLEAAIGALAITIPLALYRSPPSAARGALGWLAWLVFAAAGGALSGGVFLTLTRSALPSPAPAPSPPRPHSSLGFAVLTTLGFAAGLGYAAGLSPFVICGLAAAVIVNRSPQRAAFRRVLARGEPLAYAVLLVTSGALLVLPTVWLLVAAVVLAALRILARWAAVHYSLSNIGLGTVAQGGVAIALGSSFVFTYGPAGPAAGDPTFTTIVLGVAAAQLVAPPLMKRARARETTQAAAGTPAAPLTSPRAAPELSANAPVEWPQ
jgi:hypothetical protein